MIESADTLAEANGAGSSKAREAKGTDEIAKVNYTRFVRARDNGHATYVEEAEKYDKFYSDIQWDEADLKKLKAEGRPALTINMIRPTVNAILGQQISRRIDTCIKHKRGGSETVATVLTKLFQSIGDDVGMDRVESQVFSDGIIQDRGYFDVRIGYKENMVGEVEVCAVDPKDILLDVDAKEYDPRTWAEVFKTGWMSLEEIAATYGEDKAAELSGNVGVSHFFAEDSILFDDKRFGEANLPGDSTALNNSSSDHRNIRKVRVIERQYYKLVACWYFVDPQTGDCKLVAADWDKERREEFATRMGLFLHKRMDRRVRWCVTADYVVLHDEWSPYTTFTIIPFFPYFRRGRPTGVVRGLISPQELINKVSSQELHIVNTTANSGYILEDGTLSGMTTDELKTKGAQTGTVITVGRGRKEGIEKIQPNTIPTGLDRIGAKAQNNFRVISGVNDAMLG